jgi:hypothetical protein
MLKKIHGHLWKRKGLAKIDSMILDVFVGIVEMQADSERRQKVTYLLSMTDNDYLKEIRQASLNFALAIDIHLEKRNAQNENTKT